MMEKKVETTGIIGIIWVLHRVYRGLYKGYMGLYGHSTEEGAASSIVAA